MKLIRKLFLYFLQLMAFSLLALNLNPMLNRAMKSRRNSALVFRPSFSTWGIEEVEGTNSFLHAFWVRQIALGLVRPARKS